MDCSKELPLDSIKTIGQQKSIDIVGRQFFYKDSCSVVKSVADKYIVVAGDGYVGGLRFRFGGEIIEFKGAETYVWLDVSNPRFSMLGVDIVVKVRKSLTELKDYTDDDGIEHHVEKIAHIVDGAVTDLRESVDEENFLLLIKNLVSDLECSIDGSFNEANHIGGERGRDLQEILRKQILDLYGRQMFQGSACLLTKQPSNMYRMETGTGYVGGLRFDYEGSIHEVTNYPVDVYLDASLPHETGNVEPIVVAIFTKEKHQDWMDECGVQHFAEHIASIDSDGDVHDYRELNRIGSLIPCTGLHPTNLGVTDLNTLVNEESIGNYYQPNDSDTIGNNYPLEKAGALNVMYNDGVTHVYWASGGCEVFVRNNIDGKWGEWSKFYNTENKPTKKDVELDQLPNAKSDRVDVTSSEVLATSKAVKTANDNASGVSDDLDNHVADDDNPHDVTKEQVGLGNLPNEVTDDVMVDRSDVLPSSKATHTAYSEAVTALSDLGTHTKDKANPHGVTVSQINAVPNTRKISTTAPLSGGGTLGGDRSLKIDDATTSRKGAVRLSSDIKSKLETEAATIKAVSDVKSLTDSAQGDIDTHANTKTGNPHGVTKTDIKLDKVNNWSASSSVSDPSATTYATTKGVKDAYDRGSTALSTANTHAADKANPHGVTAAQAGALGVNATAKNSEKVGGVSVDSIIYGGAGSGVNRQDDLDDVVMSGFYNAHTNNISGGPTTGPYGEWLWYLNVGYNSTAKHGMQLAGENSSTGGRFWLRSRASNGTGTWTQIYTRRHKPTAEDVGALSTAGGTITGDLSVNGPLKANAGVNPWFDINDKEPDYSAAEYPLGISVSNLTNANSFGWPFGHNTIMTVRTGSSTTRMFQILADNNSSSLYWRSAHNNASDPGYWKPFRKIYHEGDKPTPSELEVLPTTGGNLTGNLTIGSGNDFRYVGVDRGDTRALLSVNSSRNAARFFVNSNSDNKTLAGIELYKDPYKIGYTVENNDRGTIAVTQIDARSLVNDGVMDAYDMDVLIQEGTYTLSGTWKNTPFGNGNVTVTARVTTRLFTAGTHVFQEYFLYNKDGSQIYTRTGTGDPITWGAWVQTLTSNQLVNDTSSTAADRPATANSVRLANNNANGRVSTNRKINTTAPLTGGGDLNSDLTIGVQSASETQEGVVRRATYSEVANGVNRTAYVAPDAFMSVLYDTIDDELYRLPRTFINSRPSETVNGSISYRIDNKWYWKPLMRRYGLEHLGERTARSGVGFGDQMILGFDGGHAIISNNNGLDWRLLDTDGLNTGSVNITFLSMGSAGSSSIVVAGTGGYASRSIDRGGSWYRIARGLNTGANYDVNAVHYHMSVYIALTSHGYASRSTNHGNSWSRLPRGLNCGTVDVHGRAMCSSGDNIIAGFDSGYASISSDRGVTWKALPRGLGVGNHNILSLASQGNVVVAGMSNGYSAISTDNGNTWKAGPRGLNSGSTLNYHIYTLATVGENVMVSGAAAGYSAISYDGGLNWEQMPRGVNSNHYSHDIYVMVGSETAIVSGLGGSYCSRLTRGIDRALYIDEEWIDLSGH